MRRKRLFLGAPRLFAVASLFSPVAFAQFSQQGPKLTGADAVGGAELGVSAALSADGNTVIVGGFNDDSSAGAAWIWTRSGGVWAQEGSKLVGSGAVGNAAQGISVALSADGNTAIVGGYADDHALGGVGVGAAWVWTRSGGLWSQQGPKLIGSGAVGNAFQGYSVAISGDGNTAIVGGIFDNSVTGAAWVWTRSGGVWTQQGPKLVGSGGTLRQGYSVALSADGNTALIGEYEEDNTPGGAWIWTRSGGVWTQQGPMLVGADPVGVSRQGCSVSLSADGNTALVGGFSDNNNAGAAWVWTRSGGVWTQQGPKLVGSGAVGTAAQGISVSLSGDGSTAIVGGLSDDSSSGAAWVWTRSGATWTQQGAKLTGSGAAGTPVYQGYSVSLSADATTAVLGGIGDNGNAGAAWVFASNSAQATNRVIFVGVRGSGEPYTVDNLGLGETVKAVYETAAASISGLESFGIPYDALSLFPLSNLGGGWLDSEFLGEELLRAYLAREIEKSPDVSFLLCGYSQGAMVVGNVLQSLDAATASHVLGLGLMGDPEFNPASTVDHGTFNKKLSGFFKSRPEFDAVFQPRTVSYCISGDPVCNFSNPNAARCAITYLSKRCPHLRYTSFPSEKGSYALRIGEWLAEQYVTNRPTASVPPSFQIEAVTHDGKKRRVNTVAAERDVAEPLQSLAFGEASAWTRVRKPRKGESGPPRRLGKL